MRARAGAALVAAIFALGFGAGGAFALYILAGQLHGWWQARSWHAVSAKVIGVELKPARRASTTYKTLIAYRYVVNGHTYEGNRLAWGGVSSGAWQREQYTQLQAALSDRRPIEVWVDPIDPTRSVVDRNLRPRELLFMVPFAMLFPLVSIGAWWVLIRVTLTSYRSMPVPRHR